MEHLTKQQIVLLTLLVSFVTSLATGIFTVSLMDQAPDGVTHTINRVVERTIEKVVQVTPAPIPVQNTAAVVQSFSQIVGKVSQSIVRIKPQGGTTDSITGLGIVISTNGLMLTDKAVPTSNSVAVFPNGEEYPIQIIQSEIIGDNVFAAILVPLDKKLSSVQFSGASSSPQLGESIFALTGKQSSSLEEGVIKKIPEAGDRYIDTTIPTESVMLGSPIFNQKGELIGYRTTTAIEGGRFNSLINLKSLAPVLSR